MDSCKPRKTKFAVVPTLAGNKRMPSNDLQEADRKAKLWRETTARHLPTPWDVLKGKP